MLSDLPSLRLDSKELQVYLIRHGIEIHDIAAFTEQLSYFTRETIVPSEHIFPFFIHNGLVGPYHVMYCFADSYAAASDLPYLTIEDECEVLVHLLRCLDWEKDGTYRFHTPPFYGLPSPKSSDELSDALLSIKVDPDRLEPFLSDLSSLLSMCISNDRFHNTIILAPPAEYTPYL